MRCLHACAEGQAQRAGSAHEEVRLVNRIVFAWDDGKVRESRGDVIGKVTSLLALLHAPYDMLLNDSPDV